MYIAKAIITKDGREVARIEAEYEGAFLDKPPKIEGDISFLGQEWHYGIWEACGFRPFLKFMAEKAGFECEVEESGETPYMDRLLSPEEAEEFRKEMENSNDDPE